MKIEVPYHIGEEVQVNGEKEIIRGIHIYVTQSSEVAKWRFHVGGGRFVSVENIEGVVEESKKSKPRKE